MKRILACTELHAFLAGGVAVFGFAPFGFFLLPVLALALLFYLWEQAVSPAQGARLGFAFGMGLFGVGVNWIYVALHDYGQMPPILAAFSTLLFAALIATLPALAGYAQAKIRREGPGHVLLTMTALWSLDEWMRGWLFTGFPWLSLGYSQVPYSPLAGFAPVVGVYGVSLAVALSAAALIVLWRARMKRAGQFALALLFVLWAGGAVLHSVAWTQPQGDLLHVSLLQGNIAQDSKFEDDALVGTLETYRRLALNSDARLIVLPETALPLLRADVPVSYQDQLRAHMRRNGGDILIGVFEKENGEYFNSVYSLGSAPSQHYRKEHLVPFGEFIPLRGVLGWFINDVLDIPMGDLSSGGMWQAPLAVAGQQVAVDICYEDAFGEEIIRALPQATLLVNVTNDAWYGDSNAAAQHSQLSQARALESGRMLLRATNTGVTSVIGTDGRVRASLPQFTEGVLTAQVQGYTGSTPYVRWGNSAMLILCILMLGATWKLCRR